MRLRTYLGYLFALLAVIIVSFLSLENRELLDQSFRLGGELQVPLFVAGILVFLVGFLPPATVLFVKTLRQDLAERQARRTSRQEVSLDQALKRAIDFQADGQLGRVVVELEVLLRERDDDFQGLLFYGEALRGLGRVDEALQAHQRAATSHPQSVAALYQLAEDYEQKGEKEVADEIRRRIVREFPGRGVVAMRHQRDLALQAADWEAATRVQDEIDALLVGGPDEAAAHRDSGLRRGLVYQRGVALLEAERTEDAADIFEDLLRAEPGFIPARIMIGEARLLQDDEAGALREWRAGFLETGSPVFLQRLEDYFLEQEEPMRAIETLRAVIAGTKQDTLPRFFLGRLYYRLEMHDEAERILLGIADHVGASPTYHFLLGRIRERRGEIRLAAQSYLESARLLGVRSASFRCRSCGQSSGDWRDRCESCSAWNSVELGFEQEQLASARLGAAQVPAWGGDGEGGSFI